MSSSGSVSSGLDLDALEEWATTTIATVERGVEEKLAEMDSKVRDLENSNASLKENCKDLDELLQKSNLKVVMLEGQLAMSELNRKAEEDARKMLEGKMEHDHASFNEAKEEWFLKNRKKDEKVKELENTVQALTEEKEAHILKIATLDDQWRGAVKQAIEDRVEFGKKSKESEEAMRELSGKVEMLEKELVQQRNRVCEMSQLMEQEKANGMQSKMEYDVEVGKTREEVERLQGLLKNLEEKNGAMKNVIEILEQDKKTQSEKIKELECTAIQFHNKRLELEETIEKKDKAAGELIARLVSLEMELVQKRKDFRDISLANQNEKIDLKKISEDHALEIGKVREEVGRLQESLRELEEENGMMKNLIESLREDKETQSQGLRLEMVGMQQEVMNKDAEIEDLQEQHRQEKESMTGELSKIHQQLESEKAARKLEIDAKSAEIGNLHEEMEAYINQLQAQHNQEMEMARIQSEEEKEALKRELIARENEVKMLMEHEEKEAKEAAGRYEKFQNMLKRKNPDDGVEEQGSAKIRALETKIPRPGTF